jgi:hypothetical protein
MKLSQVKSKLIHETEVKGVFIRDLSLNKLAELGKLETSDEPTAALLWLFNNLICDEKGELFEDVGTEEEIKEISMMKIKAITESCMETLQNSGKS